MTKLKKHMLSAGLPADVFPELAGGREEGPGG